MIASIICVSACASVPEAPRIVIADDPENPGFSQIVIDYVQETRGWNNGDYVVAFIGRNEFGSCFMVTNSPAMHRMPKNAFGGDGASFYACVDSGTHRVENEGPAQ